jgi:hypothetical protein
MKPYSSDMPRRLMAVACFLVGLSASSVSAGDSPQPTPRPGTLAAYAEKLTLDRSALGDDTGRVILTNDSVAGLAADGSITLGTVTLEGRQKSTMSPTADNTERSRWQAAHRKQRQVIAALERRRSQLELEIDQIENQSLTARTMARLEQLELKMRQLDRDIAAERMELARIVRDARRRGAEPGWFR